MFFELYDLLFSGYVAPGLVKSGVLTATTPGLFGTTGVASFIAALFTGLFIGTIACGFLADRFGRRSIFTVSLIWYTVANVMVALQNDAFGLNLWRFVSGIGLGLEMVTIGAYLSEMAPSADARPRLRLLAGDRLLLRAGHLGARLFARAEQATGARRLALGGAGGRARRGGDRLPALLRCRKARAGSRGAAGSTRPTRCCAASRPRSRRRPAGRCRRRGRRSRSRPPGDSSISGARRRAARVILMSVFNVFQTVGFYGFQNWVPTLLVAQGIGITKSLGYTTVIALAAPVGPLIGFFLGERIERKWVIVACAGLILVCGLAVRRDARRRC